MPNDRWLYLFIRQDIPVAQQITQSNHATYSLALAYNPACDIPNIVTIGVPDLAALKRVQYKLVQNQIPHYAWTEPDFDLGFTSITTVPLDFNQKQILKNYRVYSNRNSRAVGSQHSAVVLDDNPGARYSVS
jgi:hypothetical protein